MRPRWWEQVVHFLNRTLLTGLLGGVTAGDWLKLVRDNDFAVDPPYWPRAAILTLASLGNSLQRWKEEKLYGPAVARTEVPPPLFILGHWRTGTTHLHNLLAVDPRFAFPNFYQVVFAHTFLTTEAKSAPMVAHFVTERRLQDDVRIRLDLPQEDEFALNTLTLCSPYVAWAFPRREPHYERYLTFRGVPEAEVAHWKAAFVFFLKKLTWKDGRPLLLKSPPHTCRIRLLLEMFPEARFLHIHREPYVVFQSTRHLYHTGTVTSTMQRRPRAGLEEGILRRYRVLYDAFFAERGLIPTGRFHEVAFEDLERDPMGQMRNVYEALGLPGFDAVEAPLRRYVDSEAGYQKNRFPELPAALRGRVAREWRREFEEWGYPIDG